MKKDMTYRNEIKSYIVRAGMTMSEVVEILSDEHGWSASVPNLSGKLKCGSLRYGEAVELAAVLGVIKLCGKSAGRADNIKGKAYNRLRVPSF